MVSVLINLVLVGRLHHNLNNNSIIIDKASVILTGISHLINKGYL